MSLEKNQHGVIQYPKADARRLFVLLTTIEILDRPTMSSISEYTGHNKGTIAADIEKLRDQYGVKISKNDTVYKVDSWGEILNKVGVSRCLTGRKLSNFDA